jgi:hypothetical protein
MGATAARYYRNIIAENHGDFMGTESKCTLRMAGESAPGTALLETEEILFRYSDAKRRRLRIRFADVRAIGAEAGVLTLELNGGATARLDLGPSAGAWAEKIRSPPSRRKKLGVTDASEIAVVGPLEQAFVDEIAPAGHTTKPERATLVFFAAESKGELAKLEKLAPKLRDDGALWIVYPKGQPHIRELDVLTAGRATGLKDVKVVKFSETHTALKFVRPVAGRTKRQ